MDKGLISQMLWMLHEFEVLTINRAAECMTSLQHGVTKSNPVPALIITEAVIGVHWKVVLFVYFFLGRSG